MNDERIIELLASIAGSLAEIARNTERERPEEPNLQRPIEQFRGFDWGGIEATVVKADEWGAAIVEWNGRLWTRRSPENKFGEAIWFSRAAGKDAEGKNLYLRLITFKRVGDAEPLSRAAERAITPPASPLVSARTPVVQGRTDVLVAAPGDMAASERLFADLPSASAQATLPPENPVVVGPKVSAGAAPLAEGGETDVALCPQCGKPWRFENQACREHRPPRIQPPLPEPAPSQTNGKPKVSQASLGPGKVGGEFQHWAANFAHRHPKYRIPRSEDVDLYHLLKTVGSFGIAVIDSENLQDVQQRLEAYAAQGDNRG